MTNVRFDDIELASLGLSFRGQDARQMASFASDTVRLANQRKADVGPGSFEPGQTTLTGFLSADPDFLANYTHDNWLSRLRQVKATINPLKGYRRLVLSGDDTTLYRHARYVSMSLTEQGPGMLKRPFHPIAITFENYEPFWRRPIAPFNVTIVDTVVPNDGDDKARPKLRISIVQDVAAIVGAVVQPVNLFQLDDFLVNWKGSGSSGMLHAGDTLILDSESLTATKQIGGAGLPVDVLRYYDYSGPDAFTSDGFPLVARGGSVMNAINDAVGAINFELDELLL
jgi:hypothetical protein